MKKSIAAILILASLPFGIQAQQTTEDSVKAAVTQLFDAMRQSNPDLLKASFGETAVLQTIAKTRDGKVVVRNESVEEFAAQIAKAEKGALDERIEFGMIKIDAALATVWTPYQFFLNGKFSHCGVNAFQLVRGNTGWKIQYIIDTRRREGCL